MLPTLLNLPIFLLQQVVTVQAPAPPPEIIEKTVTVREPPQVVEKVITIKEPPQVVEKVVTVREPPQIVEKVVTVKEPPQIVEKVVTVREPPQVVEKVVTVREPPQVVEKVVTVREPPQVCLCLPVICIDKYPVLELFIYEERPGVKEKTDPAYTCAKRCAIIWTPRNRVAWIPVCSAFFFVLSGVNGCNQ